MAPVYSAEVDMVFNTTCDTAITFHAPKANANGAPGRMAGFVSFLSGWIADGASAKDRFSGKRKEKIYDLAMKRET